MRLFGNGMIFEIRPMTFAHKNLCLRALCCTRKRPAKAGFALRSWQLIKDRDNLLGSWRPLEKVSAFSTHLRQLSNFFRHFERRSGPSQIRKQLKTGTRYFC
jgi:hypothetical protein